MISVIITCFNVEPYIEDCLSSVYGSTFDGNITVIIVEDVSTDNTLDKIQSFINSHSKPNITFHIIQNEINYGAGKSRQIGIEYAKQINSDYTIFIDGDDEITPDCLTKLYNASIEHNSDITSIGHRIIFMDGREMDVLDDKIGNDLEGVNKYNILFVRNPYLNNKLINCKLWDKVTYSDLRFIEDICTENRLLYYANKVHIIYEIGYLYKVRKNSLCTSSDFIKKTIFTTLSEIENYEFFKDKDDIPEIKRKHSLFTIEHIFGQLKVNRIILTTSIKEKYKNELKKIAEYINIF